VIRRNQPMLILAAGLVLLAMAVVVYLIATSGDDSPNVGDTVRDDGGPSQSTRGTEGGPQPIAPIPASRFLPLLEEVGFTYEVDVPNSFAMNISTFASSYWFTENQQGIDRGQEWGIVDGYQVLYQPKGLAADVLQGRPYVQAEAYTFTTPEGAQRAFEYLDGVLDRTQNSEAVEAKGLGNDWSAYRIVSSTISNSEVIGVYHRYSFRRGNMVFSVQTFGAKPLMNIDPARELAVIIDEKLLGERPSVEPTPIPTPSFIGVDDSE